MPAPAVQPACGRLHVQDFGSALLRRLFPHQTPARLPSRVGTASVGHSSAMLRQQAKNMVGEREPELLVTEGIRPRL